jgi:polyisoprenyl-phosphate glycosyltransferase
MSANSRQIVIVTPVFNDWVAFGHLLKRLGQQPTLANYEMHVLAVDDGSPEQPDVPKLAALKGTIKDCRVVQLACNLGHQRAIAVGLVEVAKLKDFDAVVVMDADGEDRIEDVGRLIGAWSEDPNRIVFARRERRSESFAFKIFYAFYRLVFLMLTGERISFGNFVILPRRAVQALIYNPAIWNNLAVSITRSRSRYTTLATNRGPRLAGKSRMNFIELFLHGVSAMSVYIDIVLARVLLAACSLALIVLVLMTIVIIIKFGTSLAIPGWASYLFASLTLLFVQAMLLAGFALFQLLNLRSLKLFIPALDAATFVVGEKVDRQP